MFTFRALSLKTPRRNCLSLKALLLEFPMTHLKGVKLLGVGVRGFHPKYVNVSKTITPNPKKEDP